MRSTSGMTCCHFFCSAVFSMPVCRNPMVVSALTMVSPESSSTRFSTPCVLGCCGPMLTVIVSLRSSGIQTLDRFALNQFADRVHDRPVDLLDARRVLVGHVHMNVHGGTDAAAVPSRQRDCLQPRPAGEHERVEHVRRLA